MLTLLEQFDKGTLWPTTGGIFPPEMKFLSNNTPIANIPFANEYLVPIPQVGETAILAVNIGDHILKGQALTHGIGRQYLPVHSPTSGTVKAIELRPSNHASGLPIKTCVITPDQHNTWVDSYCHNELINPELLTNDEILTKIQQAGITGMGGAEFPSHIKLSPASDIELLIINGAECEPYLTSDDRLMREHSQKIIAGSQIIHRLLKPKRVIVAIEDNKPDAIKAMELAIAKSTYSSNQARVTVIPTKYPSGSAKQLIKIITGKEVASGGRSSQLGVLVHNVGTTMAIYEAVTKNKPLIERVVTVTGQNITKPGNYWVPIGTPINHLLNYCGYNPEKNQKIVIGGPMMGFILPFLHAPVLAGTTAIIAPSKQEMDTEVDERSCIRCGECAQACPASLLPQQLYWHAKSEEYDKATNYNLRDCIECGCCSYVCPSDIPLVEYFRMAKSAIKQTANEKVQAELAKQRFEAKQQRIEQEKKMREEKARIAANQRQSVMKADEKDAVAAALARIQAKKAATATHTVSTETKSAASVALDQKAKVAAAIARAKAKKTQLQSSESKQETTNNNAIEIAPSEDDKLSAQAQKKAKIAEAIARAKAKKSALNEKDKEQQNIVQQNSNKATNKPQSLPENPSNKSMANTHQVEKENESKSEPLTPINDSSISNTETDKKAKIAAAIAKAKAKKIALAKQNKQDKE